MKPHDRICTSPLFGIACLIIGVCLGYVLAQDAALEQLDTSNVRVVSK